MDDPLPQAPLELEHHERNVDHRVPVLIVGGSLVGLSASLFLGRLGIGHLLVEKHSGTSTPPARTRQQRPHDGAVPRRPGRSSEIREAASVLADNHGILQARSLTGDDQEWLFKEIDPGGGLARFSPTGWCLCSQNDLEPVLLRCAREQGGDLRFSTELISLRAGRDGRDRGRQGPGDRRAQHRPRGLPHRGRRAAQPGPGAAAASARRAPATCSTT